MRTIGNGALKGILWFSRLTNYERRDTGRAKRLLWTFEMWVFEREEGDGLSQTTHFNCSLLAMTGVSFVQSFNSNSV